MGASLRFRGGVVVGCVLTQGVTTPPAPADCYPCLLGRVALADWSGGDSGASHRRDATSWSDVVAGGYCVRRSAVHTEGAEQAEDPAQATEGAADAADNEIDQRELGERTHG